LNGEDAAFAPDRRGCLVSLPGIAGTGLHFENIDKRYGSLFALRRVSFEIAPGECVVLAGRNGSGKTTLLRIAARLARPSSGSITFPTAAGSAANARVRTGFVAHATMVYDELTAEENLLLFARLLGIANATNRVRSLLKDVELSDRGNSLVRTFSRGMRQRMAIARALLQETSILLLDEPATGLDPHAAAWLAGTLRRLRDDGCTMVMSVHGESEISTMATRAIRLDAGKVVADTTSGASLKSILTFADA
jgi:heme exporter protein A